jgi:hypothetical protein
MGLCNYRERNTIQCKSSQLGMWHGDPCLVQYVLAVEGIAAAARLARVSLVVGREGTGVLFCFLVRRGAIVFVVVVTVLLDCSCISKILSTLSGFVSIFADAWNALWNALRKALCVPQTRCDVYAVSCDPGTDHVIPTVRSRQDNTRLDDIFDSAIFFPWMNSHTTKYTISLISSHFA